MKRSRDDVPPSNNAPSGSANTPLTNANLSPTSQTQDQKFRRVGTEDMGSTQLPSISEGIPPMENYNSNPVLSGPPLSQRISNSVSGAPYLLPSPSR